MSGQSNGVLVVLVVRARPEPGDAPEIMAHLREIAAGIVSREDGESVVGGEAVRMMVSTSPVGKGDMADMMVIATRLAIKELSRVMAVEHGWPDKWDEHEKAAWMAEIDPGEGVH